MNPLIVVVLALLGSWPVDDPVVVAAFDPPLSAWQAGHRGIDLRAEAGDPVYAISSGTIAFAGTVAGKPVVTVAHSGSSGLRSTYEPVLAAVSVGDVVRAGSPLGVVGASGGHCGGADCVHVGLRTDSTYLDPRRLIDRQPPVLKPVGAPE